MTSITLVHGTAISLPDNRAFHSKVNKHPHSTQPCVHPLLVLHQKPDEHGQQLQQGLNCTRVYSAIKYRMSDTALFSHRSYLPARERFSASLTVCRAEMLPDCVYTNQANCQEEFHTSQSSGMLLQRIMQDLILFSNHYPTSQHQASKP